MNKKCFAINMPIAGIQDCQSLNGSIHIRAMGKHALQMVVTYPHVSGSTYQKGVCINIDGLDGIQMKNTNIGSTVKDLLLAGGLWADVPAICKEAIAYSKQIKDIVKYMIARPDLASDTRDEIIYDLIENDMWNTARTLCFNAEKPLSSYIKESCLSEYICFDHESHVYTKGDIQDLLFHHRLLSETVFEQIRDIPTKDNAQTDPLGAVLHLIDAVVCIDPDKQDIAADAVKFIGNDNFKGDDVYAACVLVNACKLEGLSSLSEDQLCTALYELTRHQVDLINHNIEHSGALESSYDKLQQRLIQEVKARRDACTCIVEDDLKQKDMPDMDSHGSDEWEMK